MKRWAKRKVERREVPVADLEAILERARVGALSEEDHAKLKGAVDTLALLTRALEAKGTSVERLRRMLFGPSSEKTSRVLGTALAGEGAGAAGGCGLPAGAGPGEPAETTGATAQEKPKGHGRNGAGAYRGASKVRVACETLTPGAMCPECAKGKVYLQGEPERLVRVTGMAPLGATVYELERLRCNLCGQVFKARTPEGVGDAKYDEGAAAMIGLLKYGCGLPFNRLEKLQKDLGIPLPAATAWEVVERAAGLLAPAYEEHIRQAAQGEVLHNDDTTMKILALMAPLAREGGSEESFDGRRGVFTSGIVATGAGHRIALFFTGRQHAGENLATVLARRVAELPPPIQMCDALPVNTSGDHETIVGGCIAHGRRRFVEVASRFPQECRHVLELLRQVYVNDARAAKAEMTPEERLRFHQAESGPLMAQLEAWLATQIDDHLVEPNSGLGEAITYMRKHWERLTLFLREPRAPLDNNIVERSLKKAILHRKNSLFYKTEHGAMVGDVFMSLIHTAELAGADPFDYLVALQMHHTEVAADPVAWTPWSYREALATLAEPPPPAE